MADDPTAQFASLIFGLNLTDAKRVEFIANACIYHLRG